MIEPSSADHERLEHDGQEHLTPGGAERAQRGELAHPLRDRDRERVGDHEAADEQRDPAEAEQEVLDEVQTGLRVLAVVGRLCGRGLHLRRLRQQRLDPADELVFRDALVGTDPDQVELALLVEQPLCGGEVEDGDRGAAERAVGPEADDAADAVLGQWAVAERSDGLPHLEVLPLGGRPVDRDLAVTAGARRPSTSWSGLRLWSAVASTPIATPSPGLPDRLALRIYEPRLVLDRALRQAHAGHGLHRAEHAGGEGRCLGVPVVRLDRLLGADHRVGGLVRVLEDAVEALAEGVGEDEGAADHGDAEDDRERRQRGPQLPSEQPFQRDADHRTVTASSASRISCVVEGPRSLTIRPSARNRMRSAIAAACASCVTMTVVWP